MMTIAHVVTEFPCQICGKPIVFNTDDSETYLSKTEHDTYFGMQLTTYRVSHTVNNERHLNTVIVDQMGFFRGYRDSYAETPETVASTDASNYWFKSTEYPSLSVHRYLNALLMIGRRERWVMNIIDYNGVNLLELARIIIDRVEEAEHIYEEKPVRMEITVANHSLEVWISDSMIICADIKSATVSPVIESLAGAIVSINDSSNSTLKRILVLAMKMIEINTKIDSPLLCRLIQDDFLFVKITTPFEDRISDIAERVGKRLPLAGKVLGPLLRGYTTIIELLEGEYIGQLKEIFEIIDFVNRRGLLG
ncbi:MAG: hypothetical protein ACTSUO_01160 [Candidatus Thorarchaeota archaeon]